MTITTTKVLLPRVACSSLFLLCFAMTLHAQSSDNASYAQGNLRSAEGETIFHSICQGCHMPDAKGAQGAGTYPALAGNPRLISPNYMAAIILHGRRDMPAFSSTDVVEDRFLDDARLTDAQIASVINYIRTHFGNQYSDCISAGEVAAMHH